MNKELREAWRKTIRPEDYEQHMAAIGQAQANAELVADLLANRPAPEGSSILVSGAGTGQIFDYVSPAAIRPYRVTFTDINAEFLDRLTSRLMKVEGLSFHAVVDDIEDTALTPGFEGAIAVLVLEHVDWEKAVASLCRLARRVFVVIQENPPESPNAVTRPLPGSMAAFQNVHPTLIPKADVIAEFERHGFALRRTTFREVLDNKKMVGLEFEKGS